MDQKPSCEELERRTQEGEEQLAESRRQAERVLRESEETFKKLFDFAPDALYLIDLNGRFLDGNRTAELMVGYKKEDLIGKNFAEAGLLTSPEQLMRALQLLQNSREGLLTGPEEYVLRRKDGSEVEVEIRTFMLDLRGEPTILGIARDITERKRAEAERRELEIQLRRAQKMEAIGTLAGGIAHDFNNILLPIILNAEMAVADLPDKTPLKGLLQEIYQASMRARDLVGQILAFSRQSERERVVVQVVDLLEDALALLRATLPSTIKITKIFDSDVGTVIADPTQIHQIMMNLCTNAAHAMKRTGGDLSIGLANREISTEEAAANPRLRAGSYIMLTVSDTGHGMDEETIQRIFDPFFTTKEPGEGTGMGLSAVHGIVTSHGGAITVSSTLQKGTVFQIYLPRKDEDAMPEAAGELKPPTGHERIMLIDDEEIVVSVGKRMLERLGYKVVTTTSGAEALQLFRADPEAFDLVLSDQTMPNMTGDRLARKLLGIRSDLPIILCTGFSELISEDTIKDIGIKEIVHKPFNHYDMAALIRRVLDD